MSPAAMSPSNVPLVTSAGKERAIIFWLRISGLHIFLEQVFPQWKPINTSVCLYGYLPHMSASNMSLGTVLFISRSVTASPDTHAPIYSERAP